MRIRMFPLKRYGISDFLPREGETENNSSQGGLTVCLSTVGKNIRESSQR